MKNNSENNRNEKGAQRVVEGRAQAQGLNRLTSRAQLAVLAQRVEQETVERRRPQGHQQCGPAPTLSGLARLHLHRGSRGERRAQRLRHFRRCLLVLRMGNEKRAECSPSRRAVCSRHISCRGLLSHPWRAGWMVHVGNGNPHIHAAM